MNEKNKNQMSAVMHDLKEHTKLSVKKVLHQNDTQHILSKILSDPNKVPVYDRYGNRKPIEPNYSDLRNVFSDRVSEINDNKAVMQMLPEIESASQILIPSIISPKDMVGNDLIFVPPESILPSPVSSSVIDVVREHFTQNYKIEESLYLILKDILYITGSYCYGVIPENVIDDIINNGHVHAATESIKNRYGVNITKDNINLPSKGILGGDEHIAVSLESIRHYCKKQGYGLENMSPIGQSKNDVSVETHVSITDNYALLSYPKYLEKKREISISRRVSPHLYGLETLKVQLNDQDIDELLYRKIDYKDTPVVMARTPDQSSREIKGDPLVVHFPSECVVPIYVPGDVSKHIGYFVLLDAFGNPVSGASEINMFRNLQGGSSCLPEMLLAREKSNIDYSGGVRYMGDGTSVNDTKLSKALSVYTEIMENELYTRLRNGVYGKNVEIPHIPEIYRIMFARSLAQQKTQVLFLPKELFTYMAFKYNNVGVGVSMLEDMKPLTSQLIALNLANNRAGILNSIPRTKYIVDLDEDDPDPEKTIQTVANEIYTSRIQGIGSYHTGIINPREIVDQLNTAGISIEFNGPAGMPNIKISTEEFSSNVPEVNTELAENLRKRIVLAQGLSPDMIDSTMDVQFAESIVSNNINFTRKVMIYQDRFCPLLSEHIRKVCLYTPRLINQVSDIIYSNFKEVAEYLLENKVSKDVDEDTKRNISDKVAISFIRKMSVELPKPDTLRLQSMIEKFDQYSDAAEKFVDHVVSDELINSELYGDLADHTESLKKNMVSQMVRDWVVKNNFFANFSTDEDSVSEMVNNIHEHNGVMVKAVASLMEKGKPLADSGDMFIESNGFEDSGYVKDDHIDNSTEDESDTGVNLGEVVEGGDLLDLGEEYSNVDGDTDDM